MRERTDHLTDDAITRLLQTRSADAPPGLLDDIMRTAGATHQERPWLALRPIAFPQRVLLLVALGLLLVTMGAIAVGSRLIPDPPPRTSGGMWPQSNLAEVRAAQERADAGDPDYTWQRDVSLGDQLGQHHPEDASIFTRFLEEKLGWEAYLWDEAFAHREGLNPGDVIYLRCAPGRTNPLYPDDSAGGGCAPTIDGLRYETVKINAAQLGRQSPGGIWVVTGWEMIKPAMQADPRIVEAEARTLLEAFLQARIDGAGADGQATFPEDDPFAGERLDQVIPLLYAATTGAAYERSEFERVEGPLWPDASMQFAVSLFAENGQTEVEQVFSVERDDTGRLRLVYEPEGGSAGPLPGTSENGQAVPMEYAFLDGEVTYRAAYPLGPSQEASRVSDRLAIDGLLPDDGAPRRILSLLADARLLEDDCVAGPPLADAEALARSIESDPRYEGTAPVPVTIGGLSALQMDGVGLAESSCAIGLVPVSAGSTRGRVYLLDLPGGSGRVLAIAIGADEDSFETVSEWAAPIVDSIEFDGG